MKTDALIDLLAQGAGPAPPHAVPRRVLPAAAAGLLASAALALGLMGPAPAALYGTLAPWIKLAYTVALALAALALTLRLARPGARPGGLLLPPALALAAMAVLGLWDQAGTADGQHLARLMGQAGLLCPAVVLALSLPALAAALWALRGLAPTRPRAAGAAAGLLAGALGACGYALSCPEVAPSFVALWYSAGVAATAALGALLGPRVLRW